MDLDLDMQQALRSLPPGTARPLSVLLSERPELVQQFRRAVLWRAAIYVLGQRKQEVSAFLRLEFGDTPPSSTSAASTTELAELDGFPTEEVMSIADSLSLSDAHWTALADEQPRSPVQWFAKLIGWRTRDHLKRKDLTQHTPVRPPTVNGQYALAYRLWVLQTLDAAETPSTPTQDHRGVYQKTLKRVLEAVDSAAVAQPADAPAYMLRKVFPRHGWRDHVDLELGEHDRWLTDRITTVESRSEAWAAAVKHATNALPSSDSLLVLLDASSAHHRHRNTGPGWPEVMTWTGEGPVTDSTDSHYKQRRGLRAKRITRLNKQLLAMVGRVVDDILRQYGALGALCS